MKFQISRTSGHWSEKPCEEAYKDKIEYLETRTCSEEKFNEMYSYNEGLWKSKGTDHKANGNIITRRMEDEDVWMVDINTLQDLIKFRDKYDGRLVLDVSDEDDKTDSIEIYDDYRE